MTPVPLGAQPRNQVHQSVEAATIVGAAQRVGLLVFEDVPWSKSCGLSLF